MSSLTIFTEEIRKAGSYMNNFEFDNHKRVVYWGIRALGDSRLKQTSLEESQDFFNLCYTILHLIERLTPNQLISIFPIEKKYDGDKYGTKDYFYTMEMCKNHGLNNKINNGFEFLWDYQNWHISAFMINYMSSMSDIRKAHGEKGITEEFLEEHGVTTYTMHEDARGKRYAVNNKTGETSKIRKPKPWYLKPI